MSDLSTSPHQGTPSDEESSIAIRLSALEDIRAIEVLKWRYMRACDRKQPEEVRACFDDGAVIDYEGSPLYTDPDSFIAGFREWNCRPNVVDVHHGVNPVVELTGPDSACGCFDVFYFHIDTETQRHLQLACNYNDRFIRRDGRWLISRTVLRRISMLDKEVDAQGTIRVVTAARSDLQTAISPR